MYFSLPSRESVWIRARFLQADWKVIKWQQTRACCFRHPYEMIMAGLLPNVKKSNMTHTKRHIHEDLMSLWHSEPVRFHISGKCMQ